MKLIRKYHFHASHRNLSIYDNKCKNLHGHTYYVEVEFEKTNQLLHKRGDCMIPFSVIDSIIEPLIKELDHSLLAKETDDLAKLLADETNINIYPYESSCEVVAISLAQEIIDKFERLRGKDVRCSSDIRFSKLSLSETPSSTVIVDANYLFNLPIIKRTFNNK